MVSGSVDLMLKLGLSETIDKLAITNSVRWHCHVLMREDVHVLRRAWDFEVEGQWKKGTSKRTWKKQVGDKVVKVDLKRVDALCR